MARGLVEADLADVRREDLRVALLGELTADEILKFLADDCSFRGPENQTLADCIVDVKEALLFANLAVIALLCFFQHGKPALHLLRG